ncbi:MAG: AAA family ATPase, partial [Acidimicrobiales bacterium]
KDRTLTPERLKGRWAAEAAEVGLPTGEALVATVCDRDRPPPVIDAELVARLVDPDEGLCARRARFSEAHVVEAISSYGAGQLDVDRILGLAADFLSSEHVVRLANRTAEPGRPRPPEWSTRIHLAMERRVLDHLEHLAARSIDGIAPTLIEGAVSAETVELGADQGAAVRALCGPGPALRSVSAPPGYGKTTMTHAAAAAQLLAGRHVLGVATTNQAVSQLRDNGVPGMTIARLLVELSTHPLAENTTLLIDETSQVATADLLAVLDAVAEVPGLQLWCVGDGKQTKAVKAGGLATELERLIADSTLPAVVLTENRRQVDPAEREALAMYRAGDVAGSQVIRTDNGWEHDCGTPAATRQAMADAVVADGDRHGALKVTALAVTHADCEDLAERIRAIRQTQGKLLGPLITGPGFGDHDRHYATGDLVLLHRRYRAPAGWVHNGTVLTVTAVTDNGLTVSGPTGQSFVLERAFVEGRHGRTPNISHGWARTVDGAQGGTWAQVHLLGSAALNRYSGLVGKSRSQLPTHTWNVTRLVDIDHGGALADDRTPAEEVLDALQRVPDTAFAIHADPYQLDRHLTAERDFHLAAVAADSDGAQEWRQERIAAINRQLDAHWAQAVLAATDQGDPLAYGIDRLRAAHHTIFRQLDQLVASIPPDRTRELQQAQRELARRQETLRYTQRQAQIAAVRLETTPHHRFSRSDSRNLSDAQQRAYETGEAVRQAEFRLAAARRTVEHEEAAVIDRQRHVAAARDERDQLAADLRVLNHGLDHTRPGRVVAAARGAPEGDQLRILLGEPPGTQASLDLWCAIAERIETHLDHLPGSRAAAAIDPLLARLPELLGQAHSLDPTLATTLWLPDRWAHTLGVAEQHLEQLQPPQRTEPDRSIGLEF